MAPILSSSSHEPAGEQNVSVEIPDAYAEGAFEGPEKLLELWFLPNAAATQCVLDGAFAQHGLRAVRREVWDAMLDVVRCKVLNMIQSEYVDAYLLSESSMFVYPHKLILKTCGTTTLLKALPAVLRIAARIGLDKVWRVFYSRKTFMFPERQEYPHSGWDCEARYLDDLFIDGSAYLVGKISADHWYLYLTAPRDNCLREPIRLDDGQAVEGDILSMADCPFTDIAALNRADPFHAASSDDGFTLPPTPTSEEGVEPATLLLQPEEDQTVEILMTGLDVEHARRFYYRPGEKEGSEGGKRVDAETGLDKLDPNAQMDSYLFVPCGYSMNSLRGANYSTIHVTPEPGYSYASFETNVPLAGGSKAVTELVRQVVDIFRPSKFSVTVFKSDSPKDAGADADHQPMPSSNAYQVGQLADWRRSNCIRYEFEGYHLNFYFFERWS
ncbi:S-adenosylmethionine decarboxylase [Syncephalis pseudoplumigaleata]|uniref:S-adenosylmethionine decarboxylase n=1 Tax=Syncephalis pseudoplumigaleata TaxID=1712513 RepID=A0A4P9Z5N6_9FUNG|nr:S-adenosylmethionine decarboxylase [Syncephalis pseudoplumigaleata]|eukprot:RKP27778.1 S-adenosylmethionine decarboxylase [Syncephalis pseudoplumigaleata]